MSPTDSPDRDREGQSVPKGTAPRPADPGSGSCRICALPAARVSLEFLASQDRQVEEWIVNCQTTYWIQWELISAVYEDTNIHECIERGDRCGCFTPGAWEALLALEPHVVAMAEGIDSREVTLDHAYLAGPRMQRIRRLAASVLAGFDSGE